MTARSPGRCPRCGFINKVGSVTWQEPRRRVHWIIQRCDDCLVLWLEVPAT